MKIACADNCGGKFSRIIIDYWLKKGHEVKYEPGASEFLAEWADLYYIDWWDNNLNYLWKFYEANKEAKKPKICVRAIDWDVWCGYVPTTDQKYVDFTDYVITIAPHMYEKVKGNANFGDKLELIRPGVDLDKFPLKENEPGFNVGMITGDVWMFKNCMEGLMMFAMVVKAYPKLPWKLHWRRNWADHMPYSKVAHEHFIESRGLKDRVIMYDNIPDMNSWYDQIDYIINPSVKEAFSYGIAEAMCKGIKPIINNWYGAIEIWPKKYIYNTLDEAVMMFTSEYNPPEYRKIIEDHYDLKRMMTEYDNLLGT